MTVKKKINLSKIIRKDKEKLKLPPRRRGRPVLPAKPPVSPEDAAVQNNMSSVQERIRREREGRMRMLGPLEQTLGPESVARNRDLIQRLMSGQQPQVGEPGGPTPNPGAMLGGSNMERIRSRQTVKTGQITDPITGQIRFPTEEEKAARQSALANAPKLQQQQQSAQQPQIEKFAQQQQPQQAAQQPQSIGPQQQEVQMKAQMYQTQPAQQQQPKPAEQPPQMAQQQPAQQPEESEEEKKRRLEAQQMA